VADQPAAAETQPGPRPELECKVAFGPGAVGSVRYQAGTGHGTTETFTAAVKAGPPTEGGPALAPGDRLPVAITAGTAQSYLAGTVKLAWHGAALEGSLRLAAPSQLNFPALAAGTVVAIGGQPCALQAGGSRR
jgi:hypothetical protein